MWSAELVSLDDQGKIIVWSFKENPNQANLKSDYSGGKNSETQLLQLHSAELSTYLPQLANVNYECFKEFH